MAVYDYAEQFMRQLAQMWTREMVSYDLTQSNQGIKFLNAQTIKIPRMSVSGYKDHDRNTLRFQSTRWTSTKQIWCWRWGISRVFLRKSRLSRRKTAIDFPNSTQKRSPISHRGL